MQRTTVLFLLLLLATIQAKDEELTKDMDCEVAKESLQRSFDVLSISTRQLGRQCREEKRECDKKMREFAKLDEERQKCDLDKNNLQEEVTNYAASLDEIGSELFKCKTKLENVESTTEVAEFGTELENATRKIESLTVDLETEKQEKSELQEKLENEIQGKAGLLEEISALKESEEKLEAQLQEEKESKENLQMQLDAEKVEVEKISNEVEYLKEEKSQLQKLSVDFIANNTDMKTEMDDLRENIARLEAESKNVLKKLEICNELRSQPFDDGNNNQNNEVEINRNGTEKCGRIGRDIDLTRTPAGIYFFNHKRALPWLSAKDFCRARGLDLASAETEEEIMEVGRVRSLGYHVAFWTAASDRGHPPGQFHWPSGRKVASALWFPGQPDQASHGREDCAYVFGSKLKDSPCSASFYFACQVPKECIPHLN